MKRIIVIAVIVLFLPPVVWGGYRLTSYFIVDHSNAEDKEVDNDVQLDNLETDDIAFVDPSMFTFTIFGKDRDNNQLLHIALRLVVPADKQAFMMEKTSLIQDLVNQAVYGYLKQDMTGIDYRALKAVILKKLRTNFAPDVLHGVLYHSVFIR